jgi:hypothetical protein
MTHDEFRAYWLEHHAPIQREVAERSPVRRTVVSFTSRQFVTRGTTSMLGAEAEPEFDAILELYFDDVSDLSEDFPGRAGDVASTIVESERRFTDQSRELVRIVAEEVVLVDKTARSS